MPNKLARFVVAIFVFYFVVANGPIIRAEPTARISPAGLPGNLILCGPGEINPTALKFFSAAANKTANIIVVNLDKDNQEAKKIAEELGGQKLLQDAKINVVTLRDVRKMASKLVPKSERAVDSEARRVSTDKRSKETQKIDGVWLVGAKNFSELTDAEQSVLQGLCRAVLQKKGAVATSREATLWLGEKQFVQGPEQRLRSALGILPDSVMEFRNKAKQKSALPAFLKKEKSYVGYEFGPSSALFLRGRRLYVLAGEITLHLAASTHWPAKREVCEKSRRFIDLTTLRRSARARAAKPFPSKKLSRPIVKSGTLIIIGGGGTPKGLFQKFVELAGGPKANIVILPTAMADPIRSQRGLAQFFRKAGAKSVTVLPGRKIEDVESPKYIKAFEQATGIWFGGGRQWRFVDAYQGTKVEGLMHKVLDRGGVIMGSSAGASIQGEYMARGAYYGNRNIIAEGYERGLGFLKGVAIDQHFSQRRRQKDMNELVTRYPQLLGIGIDESTAIIVQKSTAKVVGRGKVFFYDGKTKRKNGQVGYVVVSASDEYDLVDRSKKE